ncbi:MAG: HepT-like ribonuclease domain-containing protein [Geminicoccaceae bacterium]
MQPRTAALLEDIAGACAAIGRFMAARRGADLADDELLRSAVERQLTIIGEAASQIARLDPATADRLPDRRAIIGLRNILVHAYGRVNHAVIADIVATDVPELERVVAGLLR